MKSLLVKLSLLQCLALAALFGAHAGAFADTSAHGAICRPAGTADGNNVFLAPNVSGVSNLSLVTLTVVCPVVRAALPPSTGFTVWVDGYSGVNTAICALYSRDYRNVLLGSVSAIGSSVFDMNLTLPAAQVPMYSSQVVVCQLPSGGAIWDIEPMVGSSS